MPVKYIPYTPNTVEGQAILDNITRTQRVLRYRDNNQIYNRIKRGMPYYEVETIETVVSNKELKQDNLVIRGECISACAYLKEQNIKVDLVYIDPPFASGADYAKKVYIRKNPKLAEKVKNEELLMKNEELQAFEETMYGDIWKKEDYLNWMYENLQAIKSIMNDTASIYVHLDWHIGHYVKILMDEVFGEDNLRNEIVWNYGGRGAKSISNQFPRNHDCIYCYSKNQYDYSHNKVFITHKIPIGEIKKFGLYKDEQGNYFHHSPRGDYTDKSIAKLREENRIYVNGNGTIRIKYFHKHNSKYVYVEKMASDVWSDIGDAMHIGKDEKMDYSTQKPEKLLERIIKASSDKEMIVADFFGGSGVTAKVANDLGRKFIHCDIGINSIQTVRDRLITAKANFKILEIKDGVSLFRNPQQTMDKLAKLITGLQRNIEGISNFWFGAINNSKLGTIPVFVPDLIDSKQKILDIPTINRIINQEIGELNIDVRKVIVYYIDIDDEKELRKFIKDNNLTTVDVELKDMKNLLHETVVNDEVEFTCKKVRISNDNKNLFDLANTKELYEVSIDRFLSDRLIQKINAFNKKGNLQSLKNGKVFNPIDISDEGLELIELISLDCKNTDGEWFSTTEIKMDKFGYVIIDGNKTKEFWNGKITSKKKPLRIKIRNISGDELIGEIELRTPEN